ncbi:MAG: hypothetical protein AAFU57_12185 [Bacteroidota bacterium]
MRPTLLLVSVATLLLSCVSKRPTTSTPLPIPILGSVGKVESPFLQENYFTSIGCVRINQAHQVEVVAKPMDKNVHQRYHKRMKNLGHTNIKVFQDSIPEKPMFHQLVLTNVVALSEELHANYNQPLLNFLQEDGDYRILTSVSAVIPEPYEQQVQTADNIWLVEENGLLVLQINGETKNAQIPWSSLEVFDFETHQACWQKDGRGNYRVGLLIPSDSSCPGNTVTQPLAKDNLNEYLKFR